MIPVYRARNLAEAQLLVEHLERQGFSTFIRNQDLLGTELAGVMLPEVCVMEERDFEEARAISLDYERLMQQEIIGDDRPCPHCKAENPPNFGTCWSCRSSLQDA